MKKELIYLEQALAESKEIFKSIFESSPTAITVTDKEGRIIAWNSMTERMLGMEKNDLFNKPVKELYPAAEWLRIQAMNIRKVGIISDIPTQVVRKDGSLVEVNTSISILKDKNGHQAGAIGILHDMTRQKAVENELIRAKIAAEEANHAKSVFLAKMSHEVRTPMNAVIGMLDLTLDTQLTEEQKDNLKVAKDAADNLLILINDILDLSRAQADKVIIESVEINVADIVKNVCKGLAVLARNKNVNVVWSVDPEVPRILVGDPVRLRQVLVNIINNAIKFTNKGQVMVNVTLGSLTDRDCLVNFEVIDQGIGIPQKNLSRVFDVFTEAHNSTSRRYGGTGLGLAICKKLVEMMRGEISVTSIEGQGSAFKFSVIFGVQAELFFKYASDGLRGEVQGNFALPKEVKGLRILLAEDNVVNARIAVKILEKFGWTVTVVENGQQALDLLNKQGFDVVLMDDQMPVLNGIETVQVIRREEKQTGMRLPVIAMTANAMTGDRERYLAAGMDGYVSKPIDRAMLYNEIVLLVTQRLKN